ncbi:DUF389 domain-containing protein [uncultured Muriicola sp.]|uniref:DUF389 domain-containing protein n=1 Tax=uncultured Muriicola sp. TaxID=1583102 RepID=UPI00261D7CE1|nr:DUF389 domain-containing protein [uncultured Muriicola sp.]
MKKETDPANKDDIKGAEEVKKEFKGFLGSAKVFLTELLDIRKNTDKGATKDAIIADIPFKGHTAWILVCSIFICSIGLNTNSTAVVIGAMLISPLMGPILGMGLSIAVNDVDSLRRSLRSFAVMVVLSVLTAYLFFAFFPLQDESSELLARTQPDIRDVLIAFFGGLALVIARAKKGTIASVIFGVAISTALMPPLCTVGFELAIGNFELAAGAMYLFTINTIFIGLATFSVLKLLRFPMVKYADSIKRRRIGRIASAVALLVMIPAGFTFYNVFQESRFMKQADQLIKETIAIYQFKDNGRYMENLDEIKYNPDGVSSIELVTMGDETIPENVIATWRNQKNQFSRLKNTDLILFQGGQDDSEEKFKYVSELYESKKAELLNKDERIQLLEQELAALSKFAKKQIPFTDISAEAKSNYDNLFTLSFSYVVTTDFSSQDTIPVFEVKWKDPADTVKIRAESRKLNDWLKIRLKDDKVIVKSATD